MDKEKFFKELRAWLIAIGVSAGVFVIIFFIIARDEPYARSVIEDNPVTNAFSGGDSSGDDSSGGGSSGGGSSSVNSQPFDPNNLSSTYLVGFDYESGDFMENAPAFECKVRLDGKMEVEFRYQLSNGEYVITPVVYDISDAQFSEIKHTVDLQKLYNLDPQCQDPDIVCDGGFTYMYIYDKNDALLKPCGGFCPTNSEFHDMLRVLHDSLPDEMKDDALYYKKIWRFHAGNASYEHYGVFLNYEEPLMDLKYDYDTIVIDAQYKSEADIAYFKDSYDSLSISIPTSRLINTG